MKKTLSIIFALTFCIIILKSCQDDTEICGEGVTPRLVIKFFDQTKQKVTAQSGVFSSGRATDYNFSTKDSILLPLPLKGKKDTLIYHKTDNKQPADTIFLSFKTEKIFVSKGCGMKVNYIDLSAALQKNHQIIKRMQLNPKLVKKNKKINLTDEKQAHLFVYF